MRHFRFTAALILILFTYSTYAAAQTTPNAASQTLPDTKAPPAGIQGEPFEVETGLYLIHIIRIDQPNQILTGLFEITMQWKDDRAAYQSAGGGPRIYADAEADKVLSTIWSPDPEIVNQASKPSVQKSSLTIFPDGTVVYRYIFSVDVLTEFDYTRFPYDDQPLTIEIQSFTYNSNELVFRGSERYTGINEIFRSDDWIAFPVSIYTGFKRAFGYETQDRAFILFDIKLERRSLFYFLRIILPFCFFIVMSTCVFWIHHRAIDRRIGIVVTFALTSVAFNFLVLNYLPSVPYKTLLNAIITSGYFMSGLLIITIVSIEHLKDCGYEKLWNYANRALRFIFPAFMIGVWFLIYYIFVHKELQIIYLVR